MKDRDETEARRCPSPTEGSPTPSGRERSRALPKRGLRGEPDTPVTAPLEVLGEARISNPGKRGAWAALPTATFGVVAALEPGRPTLVDPPCRGRRLLRPGGCGRGRDGNTPSSTDDFGSNVVSAPLVSPTRASLQVHGV